MPVKGTKVLQAVKSTTVISTFVTGAPVAPADVHLSVYVDLASAGQHRYLEVKERLKELINRAREENYRRPAGAVAGYYYTYLNKGKSGITFTTLATDIVEGMVAIGIGATVRNESKGSIILDACWTEIIDWMSEQHRLTV